LPLLPRPELKNMPVGTHGGPDYSEIQALELDIDRILDFSVCCNPYPPPPSVRASLRSLNINSYPDPQSGELRSLLSQKLAISMDRILVGNGTTELIRLIGSAYFNIREKVLIVTPTYGEYEIAGRIAGAEILEYRWEWQKSDSVNIKELREAIGRCHPKAVFLCNPNNPTGYYLGREEIASLVSNLDDGLLILDEAYINFVDRPWSSLPLLNRAGIIILRSMTKDYGLAGLRLGYALAGEDIIHTLSRVCPPWNVNSAAQKAGIAVLEAEDYLKQSQNRIRTAQQFLIKELSRLGLTPLPSETNFFLVKAPGGGKSFRKTLLRQGFLVRDCSSFGLSEYVRIAPRTLTDCRKLINAIKKLRNEGSL
jgi:histidinol-phosphate aminotransferase